MKTAFWAALALFAIGCGGTTTGTTTTTGGATGGTSGGSTGTPAFDSTKTYGEILDQVKFPPTFVRIGDNPWQTFTGEGGLSSVGDGYINLPSTERVYTFKIDVPAGVATEGTMTVRGTGTYHSGPTSSLGIDIYGEMVVAKGKTRYYVQSYAMIFRSVNDHSKMVGVPVGDSSPPP